MRIECACPNKRNRGRVIRRLHDVRSRFPHKKKVKDTALTEIAAMGKRPLPQPCDEEILPTAETSEQSRPSQ